MNEPGIDLTGKLIIKVALGDDIRRILITNEDITYDELVLMMQRVYRGKLNSSDDIVIKYKDEDNDLITIFESSDLNFAIQCSRILKITLFVNGKPEPLQTDEVKMIKSELKCIRERCNKLIDKLDERQSHDTSSSTIDSTSKNAAPQPNLIENPRSTLPHRSETAPSRVAGSKEFDPLSTHRPMDDSQSKVMSSFGISNDERPGTPDSITSVGSASSNRPQQQQRGETPTNPGAQPQQGQMPGMFPQGSEQNIPPWQNQLDACPSPYSPSLADQQEHHPALMMSQPFPPVYSTGQNSWADKDGAAFKSHQHYQSSLMQSHMFTAHDDSDSPKAKLQDPSQSMSAGSATQGYTNQTQSSQLQPGYAQPATAANPYGAYNQQSSTMPGQHPSFVVPQQQQQVSGAFGAQPQQPAPALQQQIPQQLGTYTYTQQQQQQQPQQQPGFMPSPSNLGASPTNPYARQGMSYTAGYPRPTGNYPGFQ